MLRKYGVRQRMIAAIGLVMLLPEIIAVICYTNMRSINNQVSQALGDRLRAMDLAMELKLSANQQRLSALSYLQYGDSSYIVDSRAQNAKIASMAGELNKIAIREDDRRLLATVTENSNTYARILEEQLIPLFVKGDLQYKEIDKGPLNNAQNNIDKACDMIEAHEQAALSTARNNANSASSRAIILVTTLAIISIIIGEALFIIISRSITVPIIALSAASNKIASGDLTVDLDTRGNDEISRLANSFQHMLDSLKEIIRSVLATSESVVASSEELSASASDLGNVSNSIACTMNQVAIGSSEQSRMVSAASISVAQLSQAVDEVAKGAQNQAVTVDGSVTLVQQINDAIEIVASTARSAADTSQHVVEVARYGKESVDETIKGIEHIQLSSNNAAKVITQLGDKSKQIGIIVETIDDIAEQTNLLALNAAIEAARAGEHGRGFAVVADEVRKLAERSSKATQEIDVLISNIQDMTLQAINAVQAGNVEVEKGTERAGRAGEALFKIQQAVYSIVQQIEDMSAASQQMSASSTEVVRSVESLAITIQQSTATAEEMAASSTEVAQVIDQVASVSEENAAAAEEVSASTEEQNASVEEMSAAAEDLARMAQDLQTLVSQFKIGDNIAGRTGGNSLIPIRSNVINTKGKQLVN